MHPLRRLPYRAAALLLGGSLAAQVQFTDVTQTSGVDLVHSWGVPGPIELMNFDGMEILMHGGGATGDFDRDGWPDLLLLAGGGGRDRIYWNRADGTFQPHKNWAWKPIGDPGPPPAHQGGGVAVGDFDDDGWVDVFIASLGPTGVPAMGSHRLWRNRGDGTFENVATQAGVAFTSPFFPDGMGAAFGDYDLDGDLDLVVAGWRVRPTWGFSNRLLRNEGNGTFTDVTAQSGVLLARFAGFQPAFADMDGDRYPEIVSTGDYKTSRYFVNNGDGTFTHFTAQSGTGQDLSGMGSTVADFDGDGLLDWFVTAIHDPAGGWDGNKMYLNLGGHQYAEVAALWGIDNGWWGWGTYGADFDNDGRTDVLETNGWWFPGWENDPDCLWLQTGPAVFVESATQAGTDSVGQGRGLIVLDWDEDGDLDYVVTRNNEPPSVYRNDLSGPGRHWLRVDLDTSANPGLAPQGWGSRIVATAGTKTWVRYVGAVSSYLCQSELTAHFGLGAITQLDSLAVEWTDGSTTTLTNVAADQALSIAAP